MENDIECDYLIVGQGLAGTCLAYTLLRQKQKVYIIDQTAGQFCSSIAAGTFNPLVFRTFTPTWKAENLISFLQSFYLEFGRFLQTELLHNKPILKVLKNEEQVKLWAAKSSKVLSSNFIQQEKIEDVEGAKSRLGFGRVIQTGNIDVNAMISGFRNHLSINNLLETTAFRYDQIEFFENENKVRYRNIWAKKIIFCQGFENKENPFFNFLPFKLTKGEVLIIESKGLNRDVIIHNNINIVPIEGNKFWVGSTFEWNDLSLSPTQAGYDFIKLRLDETLSVEYKVVKHLFGIRPTVSDRRAILGIHPKHNNLAVFNGLGTRGVMLAPYLSKMMSDHLIHQSEIDPEVDIKRFSELM